MKKNTIAKYSSMEELGVAYGFKPFKKRTKDENKLKAQRERFISKHRCKACGNPMTYIGGNIMSCQNERCKGIPITRFDLEGKEFIDYVPSYHILDDLGADIAKNIFD